MAIGFVNLINLIQPLLLQEKLGMTGGEGDFTANLYIVAEITTLLVAAPLANLSDIVGRKPIFAIGFLLVCMGILLVSTATTGIELMLMRIELETEPGQAGDPGEADEHGPTIH